MDWNTKNDRLNRLASVKDLSEIFPAGFVSLCVAENLEGHCQTRYSLTGLT